MIKIVVIFLLLIVVYLFSDRGVPQSVRFHDTHVSSAFEKILIEEKISYEKKDEWFWYNSRDKEEIDKISSEVTSRYFGPNTQIFSNKDKHSKAVTSLSQAGIEHYVFETDDGTGVGWEKEKLKEGKNIALTTLGIPDDIKQELLNTKSNENQWLEKAKKGAKIKRIDLEPIKEELKHNNIEYRVSDTVDGVIVTWEEINNVVAMEIVMSVVSERERRNGVE